MIENFLLQALEENNYFFSDEIQKKFLQYLELLQKWNKAFNLTAIRDVKEMVNLHILDSLSVLPYLYGTRMLDVGTGAGLPGLILAIVLPEKFFVLLDSNSKKTHFLTQVQCSLKLKNIEIVHARSEDFHPSECFDTILSRALASLAKMMAITQHLICPHGRFVAMKGLYPKQEIEELASGIKVSDVVQLQIKGIHAERHVVILEKS